MKLLSNWADLASRKDFPIEASYNYVAYPDI